MQAPMEGHWLILGRVLRVVPPEAVVAAQAQHATVGEAEQAAQEEQEQVVAVGEAEDAAQVELVAAGYAEVAAQAEQAAVGEAEHAAAGEAEVAAQAAGVEAQHAVVGPQAQLEQRVTVVDAAAAEEAAQAAAEPDFTISVAPPPRVTFLTAGNSSHPVPAKPDEYPYIIASGPFCLLARFSTGQYHGTSFSDRPRVSHLVVVRHFRNGANGQIAATAERVPRRTRDIPDLSNVESVGFLCNHDERTYTIAELRVVTGRFHSASLVCYRSSSGRWSTTKLNTPSALRGDRVWEPHGAVAFHIHNTVVWFDLSWGILTCDCDDLDRQNALRFYDLPLGRALGHFDSKSKDNIHTRRCITVSGNMVRYVEIVAPTTNGEAATVWMWYRIIVGDSDDGRQWCPNYKVSFEDIRNHPSYIATELPQPQNAGAVPDLVCVSPVNPSVVYFALDQRLFGVDVPNHLVLHCENYQLVEVPRQPRQQASGRFIVTWNLHPPGVGGNVGYVSQEPYVTFPEDVSDDEDEVVPESKTTAWGRRGSKSVRIMPMGVSRRRRQ